MLVAFFFGFKDGKSCANGEFFLVFHNSKWIGLNRQLHKTHGSPPKSAPDADCVRNSQPTCTKSGDRPVEQLHSIAFTADTGSRFSLTIKTGMLKP